MTRQETAQRLTMVADYVTALLERDGAMPCREVKWLTQADLELYVSDRDWQTVRERVGISTERVGSTWWWSLRTANLEAEVAAWLDSPHGRFAEYLAEQSRMVGRRGRAARMVGVPYPGG
jgi:hypothetical protein